MGWPPRFLFTSGRVSIDFVHTGGEGRRSHRERWNSTGDLADWLRESPHLALDVHVVVGDLADARELREALWEAAQAIVHDGEISGAARGVIQRFAASPDLVPTLMHEKRAWASGSTGAQALSTVARDAIELFGSDLRTRLRECRNPTCPLLFVDLSRPGKRAWCTMRRCGNLEKVSRYRESRRVRSESGGVDA